MQRAVLVLIRRSVRSILSLELLVKRLAFATRFNATVMKRFVPVSNSGPASAAFGLTPRDLTLIRL
jgi:hypothetical protein